MALDLEEQDQEEHLKNLWSKYKNMYLSRQAYCFVFTLQ